MTWLLEWLFGLGEALARREAKRRAAIEESDRELEEELDAADKRAEDASKR